MFAGIKTLSLNGSARRSKNKADHDSSNARGQGALLFWSVDDSLSAGFPMRISARINHAVRGK
jgi:hypothetical protein